MKTLAVSLLLSVIIMISVACTADVNPLSSPLVTTPALTPADGQQQIIDDVMNDLMQQGVPVKSARLIGFDEINPPIVLEFTLRSSDDGNTGASEDPINFNLVYRTANLARRDGLNIGAIGIVFIDDQDKQITRSISAVTDIDNLPPEDDTPYALDAVEVVGLLKAQIVISAPSSIDIQVYQGISGLREAIFNINVKDIQTANDNIRIVGTISRTVWDLNSDQDARISAYRINITDASGEPLLKLSSDFTSISGGSTDSWEAKGLKNWGYPSPPPEETFISRVKDFISNVLSAIGIDTRW